MRTFWSISFLLIFLCVPTFGQNKLQTLSQSRKSSYYTYILKLNKQQVEKLDKEYWGYIKPGNFISIVDSFRTDSGYRKTLPEGNYLYIKAEEEQITAQLHLIHSFRVVLEPVNNELAISVLDSLGKPIPDAIVKVGKNPIPYNSKKLWYSLPKSNKQGLLEVAVGDCVEFNEINRERNNIWILRVLRIIGYSFPIRQIASLPRRVISIFDDDYRRYSHNRYSSYYSYSDKYGNYFKYSRKTTGYIDFNKPKYLLHDTVKCKAYICNKNGKPYTKPLYFFLYNNNALYKPIFIKEVSPSPLIRGRGIPGSYTLEFPLGDTLQLDYNYDIVVAKKTRNNYIIFQKGSFRYEDYQLDQTHYYAKMDKSEYVSGDSIILHASGSDANGLPILDGTVKVTVLRNKLSEFYKDSIYVKDTLFSKQCPLKDAGERKISIPDSVIPLVKAEYTLKVQFNNSNFETHDTSIDFSIDEFAEALELHTAGDYIIASHQGSKPNGDNYFLQGYDRGGATVFRRQITFPYKEQLNTLVKKYDLYCSHQGTVLEIENDSSGIETFGIRTKDSAKLYISNPLNIPVQYFIYKNHKEVFSGNTNSTYQWKTMDKSMDDYLIQCNYMWGGLPKQLNGSASLSDKSLKIEITQPHTVSPGDKTDVSITVKDYKGNPVPDMNLTASCVNAEFKENATPDIPYFGKSNGYIPGYNYYSMTNHEITPFYEQNYITPWWTKRLSLDTISYYKAIFPKNGLYIHYDSLGKAEAQFAPYVFNYKKHELMRIITIYIDNDFVYYYEADPSQPYSFIASPGYHKVQIRLYNKTLEIDSVLFKKNYKLQMCIEDSAINKKIFVFPEKPYLTKTEEDYFSNCLLHISKSLDYSDYFIWQDNKVRILHHPGYDYYGNATIDLGPFQQGGLIHYAKVNSFNFTLPFYGYYSYDASPKQYVILKQLYNRNSYIRYKNNIERHYIPALESMEYSHLRFGDTALSQADLILNTPPSYYLPFILNSPEFSSVGNGAFTFELKNDSTLFAVAMERNKDDSLNHWLFQGDKTTYYDLAPGTYHFQFITAHYYYFETTVTVHPNSTFCRFFTKPHWTKLDTTSVPYKALFKKLTMKSVNDGYSFGNGKLKFKILDSATNQPLPFANVGILCGGYTVENAQADIDGIAELDNVGDCKYTVEVFYVGYNTGYFYPFLVADPDKPVELKLSASGMSLNEVVMVADMPERHFAADMSIQSIIASSPGVVSHRYSYHQNVRYLDGNDENKDVGLGIRGSRADSTEYIIDGQKVTPDLIPPVKIGGELFNGVFKDSITQKDISAKSMRNKYSDYAYWEPNLMTNEKGEVKFNVTFPDNITGWKTHAEGMDNKKRTGMGFAFTRSFRKISAQLEMPRFLIAGDESSVIAKALNYTSTPYTIKSKFSYSGNLSGLIVKDTLLTKTVITPYPIEAGSTDSLRASFEIELENGYKDGENRSIPIYPVGVKEKIGTFLAMNKDTSFSLSFDSSKGPVSIHIESDPFDFLQYDIDYLRKYPYECNEQVSSKILGLLAEKKINESRGEKFRDERELQKLISKLTASQNKDGSWGWWNGGHSNPWMTAYVLNALHKAQSTGYSVSTQITDNGFEYLRWSLKLLDKNMLLFALKTLSDAGQPALYDSLLKHINTDSLNTEQLINFENISKKQKLSPDSYRDNISKVLKRKEQTLFGNIYWAGKENGWYDNSLVCTMAAFELFYNDSLNGNLCDGMFNYFLEQRKYDGMWMNTVQTARLLDILTPYIISRHKTEDKPAIVSIKNNVINTDIKTFPYTNKLQVNSININKSGGSPVYFTAYQNVFNPAPQPIDKRFSITTHFKGNRKISDTITPGEPLTLVVDVDVKEKGEYLMLSVPIPAGCSYGDNQYNHNYQEVHREQYKDRTNIYFEELNTGHYEFSINLQARFAGKYTLNPAQMESMYFPTLNGRNAVRRVVIKL